MLGGHKGDALSVGMGPARSALFLYQMSGDEWRGEERRNFWFLKSLH